jgi:subtilisin family serine protease
VDGDDDPEETADGIDGDLDGVADEGTGHGTMVAGIVHLVAPGAKLLPVRVLDDEGRGLTFQVAKGIRYAIETGAHVVNLSFGLDCESAILREEITRATDAGLILVAAAGNDGSDTPIYPANDPLAICVAGLDSLDIKATFSSYGESVDISAPAVGVYSTFKDGGYGIGDGTSFAAPIVSGQAALVRATNPDLSREEVEAIMGAGVVDIYGIPENAEYVDFLGSGRVDAFLTWSLVPASADVDAVESGPRLRAYPNPSPAGGWVTVELVRTGTTADMDTRVGAASSTAGAGGLSIHDATGRLVRRLGEPVTPGRYGWDGRDESGRIVPSGLYWVRDPQADTRLQVVILPR